MAKNNYLNRLLNTPFPTYGAWKVDSLDKYIDLIKNLCTNNLSNKEEQDRNNIREFITGNSFVQMYLSEDALQERLELYRDYLKKRNTTQYRGVLEIDPNSRIFYRGQPNSDFMLEPSVFRDNYLIENEEYFYHEMVVRFPESFMEKSHLDKLVTLQHFGTKTRLLDLTANPLTALYFACQPCQKELKDNTDHRNEKTAELVKKVEADGKVFVFVLLKDQLLFSDSDRVLMLSCLPRFTYEFQMKLLKDTNSNLLSDKFPKIRGRNSYHQTVERFYHEVCREQPSFERNIKPIDLLSPVFVKPEKTNPRILKQDGAFLISGLNQTGEEAAFKNNFYVNTWIIIPADKKAKLLKELDIIGINKASLFPDLENTGNYLQEKVKP